MAHWAERNIYSDQYMPVNLLKKNAYRIYLIFPSTILHKLSQPQNVSKVDQWPTTISEFTSQILSI